MKTHKILLLALIVSAVLSVSAQADKHHGNDSDSQVVSRPARSNSSTSYSGSGYRSSGRPTFAPSQRFSSPSMRSTYSPALRADSFRQRSFNPGGAGALSQRQFTPRTLDSSDRLARFENSRRLQTIQGDRFSQIQSDRVNRLADIRTRGSDRLGQFENRRARDLGITRNIREDRAGLTTTNNRRLNGLTTTDNRRLSSAGTNNHVFARRSADWQRNWDRRRDHWWHGHRCRFVNNSWFIFDLGFTPWYGYPYDYYASDYYYPYGYDPYGYGSYGYGSGFYGGVNANYYDDGAYYSSDQYDNSTVADAQEQLARQGYYRGQIDGVFGPETRRAVRRYQSDHGLRVTGYLTSDTLQSLGLGRVAAD